MKPLQPNEAGAKVGAGDTELLVALRYFHVAFLREPT